jgi:DNA polymerase I
MQSEKDIFLLIDSHAIIHRAYHAIPPSIKTTKGVQVNAVYGFTSILLEVLHKFKPKYIICAFDSKGPTVRKQEYKEYKAQRKEIDKELVAQFPIVKEVVRAFGIPILEKDGYEADDILGTLSELTLDSPSLTKIIVTGDQDILQLIRDDVKVYKSGSRFSESKLFGASEVKEKYKFGPEYVIDYKALRGDPSDNIPGVKGVGDKTAVELICEFGHLDQIYASLDKIKLQSVKNKLERDKEIAYLSRKLATIYRDVGIDFDLERARLTTLKIDEIKTKFLELEFRSLMSKIPNLEKLTQTQIESAQKISSGKSIGENLMMFGGENFKGNSDKLALSTKTPLDPPLSTKGGPSARGMKEENYKILKDEKDVEEFLGNLEKQDEFAFDTETTGLDFMNCSIMGISFSFKEGEAFYLDMCSKLKLEFLRRIKNVFENSKIKKIAHNMKFDAHSLMNSTNAKDKLGIRMQGFYFDTMIAAYLLTGARKGIGLKSLAFSELGMQLSNLEDIWATIPGLRPKKNPNPNEVKQYMLMCDREKLSIYACCDADATFRLYKLYKKKIESQDFSKLFYDIEMPQVEILFEMERQGVCLDVDYLRQFGGELDEKINELKVQIFGIVGHEFNIDSPKQVGEVLFDELGLGIGKKTKTGAWQTNERILKDMLPLHDIVGLILEYREISKLRSTYIDSLILQVDLHTSRVHTSYNQAVTTTGRLSSSSPNLQNIPVATQIGTKIRKAFRASEGYDLISFDFSQQELRILAHVASEKSLLDAFRDNIDVHQLTASRIFDVPFEEVSPEMRGKGKTLNFSLIYGISSFGLSNRLKISREEAQSLIDSFFATYPKVKKYFDDLVQSAQKNGVVKTIFGRYRDTSDLLSSNFRVRSATKREVINFPIQGTAADQIKIAMNECYKYLGNSQTAKKLDARMILQVHDEIIFEIKKGIDSSEFEKDIVEIMTDSVKLDVKVKVDYQKGDNWAVLK